MAEKCSLLSGDKTGFATKEIPHLGIPSIKMSDGPSGVTKNGATAFPSGVAIGASFDRSIASAVALAMARDAKKQDIQILLAPCLGLARHPFGGRNFESYGEDPFLVAEMGRIFVESLQSEGVAACVKHFALNDQEFLRREIDTVISRRALLECHLRPFEVAVKAGAKAVMTAYNKVNGRFASENFSLLSILRDDWKFTGLVLTDWTAMRDMVSSWRAGIDLEMPFPDYYSPRNIEMALQYGYISHDELNEKLKRVLALVEWCATAISRKKKALITGSEVALAAAEASIVLLKNEGLLPLDVKNIHKIVVFGAGAKYARVSGGGSSHVASKKAISPLAALQARFGGALQYSEACPMEGDTIAIPAGYYSTVSGEPGLTAEYFSNKDLAGEPSLVRIDPSIDFDWGWRSPAEEIPFDNFSIRWSGDLHIDETGPYEFRIKYEYGVRLFLNDELAVDAWSNPGIDRVVVPLQAGKNKIRFEYFESGGKAVVALGMERVSAQSVSPMELASGADVAIVFAGLSDAYESEEKDRNSFEMPAAQDAFIEELLAVQPNTVVVLSGGNPVAMPWVDKAKAVLHAWYSGEMVGEAVAKVLLGECNPSGKLPVSFPKRWEDCAAYSNYPETYPRSVHYREDIHIGHRHFAAKELAPLFCFGHGLSYTQFSFSDLSVSGLRFRFRLKNIGPRDGAEVAQFYVRRPGERYSLLVGFEKCFLSAGAEKWPQFELKRAELRVFDESADAWLFREGEYHFAIGSSINELHLAHAVHLNA